MTIPSRRFGSSIRSHRLRSYHIGTGLLVILACVGSGLGSTPANRSAKSVPTRRSPSEDYVLDAHSGTRVVGTYTCEVSYSEAKGTDWVTFVPQAPELPSQINPETSLEPPGEPAREKSELARPLLMARLRPDKEHPLSSLRIQVTYQATLRSRKLRRGAPSRPVADLSRDERQRYLAEHGFYDFNQPAFREWMEKQGLERRESDGEIRFARRVFLALKSGMQYDAPLRKDFHATASCKSGRAECGGLSILFASILRANNIPARTLWGRWAKSAEPGKIWFNHPYNQTHVKAEFFARGVGWIPVDVSGGILHDKSPQGLKFFGNDPGDFITFHVDGNLDIDTLLFGTKSIGTLQAPRWWIRGSGSLKDEKVTETWQVRRTHFH